MAKLAARHADELESLRKAYSEQLPRKVREVEEAARRLAAQWSDDGLGDLYHLAHRLAGSSAIYGFQKISTAARALEAFVTASLEGRPSPRADRAAQLEALVRQLGEASAECP